MAHSANLRVVVLKCPYANWHDPATQQLFSKMVSLKLSGYQPKHFFGVMPIDGTDFLADHLLICEENPETGELLPILGVKSLSYGICEPFCTDFTIDAFLRKGGHKSHLQSLHEILEDCRKGGREIAYYSSWTVAPKANRDRELMALLKELFAAVTFHHHHQEGIDELLGLGVPKYRTDQFFISWGFERVRNKERELDNIPFRILGGIDGVFIHLKNYSRMVLESAAMHRDAWEERITVGKAPRFTMMENGQALPPTCQEPSDPTLQPLGAQAHRTS